MIMLGSDVVLDVFVVKTVCQGRSTITFQLGMMKKKTRGKTSCRMDVKIHQDVIQEDCLIVTKWEEEAQKVNTCRWYLKFDYSY